MVIYRLWDHSCIPTLEAWNQMVWPTMAAIPHTFPEAELYGYCWGQAVDLVPVMPAAQCWVMEEGGAYLYTVRALVFKGSILTYNPTLNEVEWVPAHGLANDLSWAEERSAVALANYVPCAPVEVAWITRLRAGRIVSCPGNDSSTSAEEEEALHSDTQSTNPPTDTDPEAGDESEDGAGGQTSPEVAVERTKHWCPWNWEATVEEAEGLAYDDPWSDSDTTVMGVDCSQGPELSLHDEPTGSHLTPQGVWPHTCQGHQWSTCCHWSPQLPVGMWSRYTLMMRS